MVDVKKIRIKSQREIAALKKENVMREAKRAAIEHYKNRADLEDDPIEQDIWLKKIADTKKKEWTN